MPERGPAPEGGRVSDLVEREPTEAEAADAYVIEQRIKSSIGRIRTLWIDLAADLYHFHTDELWRSLGHETFESWLATPEVELERRWVFELLSAYRELVVKQGVEPARLGAVNVGKVREILPAIRRGQVSAEEALSDCESLGRRDLEERYRGITTRSPAEPEPPLEATHELTYATCPACGSRYPVRNS
jgi:hypothetical protein